MCLFSCSRNTAEKYILILLQHVLVIYFLRMEVSFLN
jgi:hypothetical protein